MKPCSLVASTSVAVLKFPVRCVSEKFQLKLRYIVVASCCINQPQLLCSSLSSLNNYNIDLIDLLIPCSILQSLFQPQCQFHDHEIKISSNLNQVCMKQETPHLKLMLVDEPPVLLEEFMFHHQALGMYLGGLETEPTASQLESSAASQGLCNGKLCLRGCQWSWILKAEIAKTKRWRASYMWGSPADGHSSDESKPQDVDLSSRNLSKVAAYLQRIIRFGNVILSI